MHTLIVHAHPEPSSFSAALRNVAAETLSSEGHTVEVSDLYAEGFNPVAGRHDFTDVLDPARFHYQAEQQHAADSDTFCAEIRREQERVERADLLVLTFPLWWGGPPAILKGWFERVLAYGFAYEDGKRFDSGFFRGRTAILGLVTGGTEQRFSAEGTYGSIEQVLWPTQRCMLEYLGVTALEPFVAYAAPRVSEEDRGAMLAEWQRRISEAARAAPAGSEIPRASRRGPRKSASSAWSS